MSVSCLPVEHVRNKDKAPKSSTCSVYYILEVLTPSKQTVPTLSETRLGHLPWHCKEGGIHYFQATFTVTVVSDALLSDNFEQQGCNGPSG